MVSTWGEPATKRGQQLRDLNHGSMQLYIKLWDERSPDRKGQLEMLLLFSMQTFRKQFYGIASAESFEEECEDMDMFNETPKLQKPTFGII